MNRRDTLFALMALGAAGVPLPLGAQTPKSYRVGWLWVGGEKSVAHFEQAFFEGMRERGYVRGQNLTVTLRYADGDSARLPALADELVAQKPDVLLGIEPAALLFKARTSSIPIVVTVPMSDPVASGLVKSVARPGGNVTGMAWHSEELVSKHVELLHEMVPRMSRLALMRDDATSSAAGLAEYDRRAGNAAKARGLTATNFTARDAQGMRDAFAAIGKARANGLIIRNSGTYTSLQREIAAGVQQLRLPAIAAASFYAEAGILCSYGDRRSESYRYASSYVDRILKGANPADLPMEQPSVYEFVINLKTAKAIGLSVPRTLLARADRVID